jgi:hypothetical protein
MVIYTGVRSDLRERIVDEGIVECFIPDEGGLANTIDSYVQSTNFTFTTSDYKAFRGG